MSYILRDFNKMSDKVSAKSKRTRSKKGIAFDEMVLQTNRKERKVDKAVKTQVKRCIVFNDESNDEVQQVNNSATRANRVSNMNEGNKTRGKKAKTVKETKKINPDKNTGERIIDPCFQNVLRKELAMEHRLTEKNVTRNKVSNVANVNSIDLQGARKDNIDIEVEGSVPEEDLDYVDDVLDCGLSNFLEEELVVEDAKEKSTKRLPGATVHEKEADGEIHVQQSNVVPGTSQATKQSMDELTDKQLANLPRVRNLFNQFWAEKMQEMDKDKDKQVDKTGTGKNGNFIKSPLDREGRTTTTSRLVAVSSD